MESQRDGHDWATVTFPFSLSLARPQPSWPSLRSKGQNTCWSREKQPPEAKLKGPERLLKIRRLDQLRCCCYSVTESRLTLCNAVDCSLSDSSVHGILQARILEQVAISSSKGSYRPRDWTHVSCLSCTGRQILYRCLFIFIYLFYSYSYTYSIHIPILYHSIPPGKLITNFIIHFYRNLNG